MGFLLISVILIILAVLAAKFNFFSPFIDSVIFTVCSIAATIFFFAGIISAPAGYEETELVREVTLVSSSEASELNYQGKESYLTKQLVSISEEYGNTYNYIIYYELPSTSPDNTNKVYTREEIRATNNVITIIESSSKTAIMREYVTRPKKTFWSLTVGCTTREYIFNVPKDTVILVETPEY